MFEFAPIMFGVALIIFWLSNIMFGVADSKHKHFSSRRLHIPLNASQRGAEISKRTEQRVENRENKELITSFYTLVTSPLILSECLVGFESATQNIGLFTQNIVPATQNRIAKFQI